FAGNLHTGLDQLGNHPEVAGRGEAVRTASVGGDMQGIALNIYLVDAPSLCIFHELGISYGLGGGWVHVELLEYSKQDQRNHHTDRNFGKRVVQSQPPTCNFGLPDFRYNGSKTSMSITHSTR